MTVTTAKGTARSPAKRVAMSLMAFANLVALLAVLRLAIVVAASPIATWWTELPRDVDPALSVARDNQQRAATAATWISDRAIFRALLPPCLSGGATAVTAAGSSCASLIDETLATDPADGELWLFEARFEAASRGIGADTWDALRNSYRTSPAEGWIASERVVFGLRLYAAMPADLKADVDRDLELVVANPPLAPPLVDLYLSDDAFRAAARPRIDALPAPLVDQFAEMAAARSAGAG